MAKGGKRIGAGRPKGSTTLIKAIDYFNEKELKDFWADLRERAKSSDKIALYFAEQFTGKAIQPITGKDGGAIEVEQIVGMKIIKE